MTKWTPSKPDPPLNRQTLARTHFRSTWSQTFLLRKKVNATIQNLWTTAAQWERQHLKGSQFLGQLNLMRLYCHSYSHHLIRHSAYYAIALSWRNNKMNQSKCWCRITMDPTTSCMTCKLLRNQAISLTIWAGKSCVIRVLQPVGTRSGTCAVRKTKW